MHPILLACFTVATLLFAPNAFAATPDIPTHEPSKPPQQRRERPAAAPFIVPQGVRVIRDIPYQRINGRELKLDLYRPAQAHAGKPLIIWVHGGAWRMGNKNDFPSRNSHIAIELLQNGYALASLEYRLSGEATFPAQQQDLAAALQFLAAHANQYDINPNNFILIGRSAGAHLAALTAVSAHQQNTYQIRALAVFFGVYDLTELSRQKNRANPANAPEAQLLGAPPSAVPAQARAASPIHHVQPQSPPTIILHGLADTNVPDAQSRAFHTALQQHGVVSQLHLLDNARHGDPIFDSPEYVAKVVQFLNQHRLQP